MNAVIGHINKQRWMRFIRLRMGIYPKRIPDTSPTFLSQEFHLLLFPYRKFHFSPISGSIIYISGYTQFLPFPCQYDEDCRTFAQSRKHMEFWPVDFFAFCSSLGTLRRSRSADLE